jgi:glycosyltransferase involved in cell wall biosynthesis
MAGPSVPHGASRLAEAKVVLAQREHLNHDVFLLPDVASEERNWLLRHADVVLYPSSAEGFGLVPYEAACFGTPTVFTRFGPLHELAPEAPVAADGWAPGQLADAAEQLLTDRALAQRQISTCLAAGATYTWAATAEGLTALYRQVVALPSRSAP